MRSVCCLLKNITQNGIDFALIHKISKRQNEVTTHIIILSIFAKVLDVTRAHITENLTVWPDKSIPSIPFGTLSKPVIFKRQLLTGDICNSVIVANLLYYNPNCKIHIN